MVAKEGRFPRLGLKSTLIVCEHKGTTMDFNLTLGLNYSNCRVRQGGRRRPATTEFGSLLCTRHFGKCYFFHQRLWIGVSESDGHHRRVARGRVVFLLFRESRNKVTFQQTTKEAVNNHLLQFIRRHLTEQGDFFSSSSPFDCRPRATKQIVQVVWGGGGGLEMERELNY